MIPRTASILPTRWNDPRMIWVATAVLVGAAFFYKEHDLTISRSPTWTPWSAEGEAVVRGGNLLKGGVLGLVGLWGLWLAAVPTRRRLRPMAVPLLFGAAYLVWCGLSLTWSDDPAGSFRSWAVTAAFAVGAVGLARHLSAADTARIVVTVCSSFFVVGVLAELAQGEFRPWDGEWRFAGTIHPNSQGALLGLTTVALAYLWYDRRLAAERSTPLGPAPAPAPAPPSGELPRHADPSSVGNRPGPAASAAPSAFARLIPLLLLAVFVGLVLTKSRTCTAAAIASTGLLAVLLCRWPTKAAIVGGGAWLVAAAGIGLILSGVDLEDKLLDVGMMGRVDDSSALTGRVPIWLVLTDYIGRRPWTGYGYAAFWTVDRIDQVSRELQWTLREAHNLYVECVLWTGFTGLFLLMATILSAVAAALLRVYAAGSRGLRRTAAANGYVVVALFTAGVLGITESGALNPSVDNLLLSVLVFQVLLGTAGQPEDDPPTGPDPAAGPLPPPDAVPTHA